MRVQEEDSKENDLDELLVANQTLVPVLVAVAVVVAFNYAHGHEVNAVEEHGQHDGHDGNEKSFVHEVKL